MFSHVLLPPASPNPRSCLIGHLKSRETVHWSCRDLGRSSPLPTTLPLGRASFASDRSPVDVIAVITNETDSERCGFLNARATYSEVSITVQHNSHHPGANPRQGKEYGFDQA